MDNFGISAVRWDSGHKEIVECMVHRLTRNGDHYSYDEAQCMGFSDLAGLIGHDHQVWVMETETETGAPNNYDFKELVEVRGDPDERLYSTPQNSLFDLPEF